MSILVRSGRLGADGCLVRVTPESAGWSHVGFEAYRLQPGQNLECATGARELCAVLLSGRAAISGGGCTWPEVGRRESVFDGPPHAVHLPPGTTLRVDPLSPLELALCWAGARRGVQPALISPEDCPVEVRGSGVTEREIRNILMENRPAEALLVTEVVTPAGHWSSYPPHKHDTDDPPRETRLEETYYHRTRRPEGFALQTVYSQGGAEAAESLAVRARDGDVVLVARGYHPVAAGPMSDLYYLNVMAGPVRRWLVTVDPSFSGAR